MTHSAVTIETKNTTPAKSWSQIKVTLVQNLRQGMCVDDDAGNDPDARAKARRQGRRVAITLPQYRADKDNFSGKPLFGQEFDGCRGK